MQNADVDNDPDVLLRRSVDRLSPRELGDSMKRIVARIAAVQADLEALHHMVEDGLIDREEHAARVGPRVRLVRGLMASAQLLKFYAVPDVVYNPAYVERELAKARREVDEARVETRRARAEAQAQVAAKEKELKQTCAALDATHGLHGGAAATIRGLQRRVSELELRLALADPNQQEGAAHGMLRQAEGLRDKLAAAHENMVRKDREHKAQLYPAWRLLCALRDRATDAERAAIDALVPAGWIEHYITNGGTNDEPTE